MLEQLEKQGWLLLQHVFDDDELERLRALVAELATRVDVGVRKRDEAVYAARNVLQLVPEVVHAWKVPRLTALLSDVLGENAGLVRALFFDKPPEQTWALPWHKDLLIAIASDSVPTTGYSKPRNRAGTLHTEPPVEVLESMLTLRIHLDAMTLENGPLEVLSGSHTSGKDLQMAEFARHTVTSAAGDVFVMRPLLVHASGRSIPGATMHRRVLHLEFSGMKQLPHGVHWNTFIPVSEHDYSH